MLLVPSPPDVPSMIFACVLRLPRYDQQIYFSLLTTEAEIDDVERLKLVPGVARGAWASGASDLRSAVRSKSSHFRGIFEGIAQLLQCFTA